MTLKKWHYASIAEHLQSALSSHHLKVGDILPTEIALAQHYQTSRHTVRRALQSLTEQGLLVRRKKAGTRVLSTTAQRNFQLSYSTMDDLTQYGQTHTRALQEMKTVSANAALAQLLECPVQTAWLRISSLRMDQAALPIGWTDVYVSPFHAGMQDLVKSAPDVLVSTLLERHFAEPISAVNQTVCAITLGPLMANRLQTPPNSAGLRVVRRYLNAADEVIEISVSFHPADRFSMRTKLLSTR